MNPKYRFITCEKCAGDRFDSKNRLCTECGGDGCTLELLDIEQTAAGLERLINDLTEDYSEKINFFGHAGQWVMAIYHLF